MTMGNKKIVLMVFLAIITIIAVFAVMVSSFLWYVFPVADKRDTVKVQISNLEVALDSYRLDMLQYPNSLDALINNDANDPKWQGPYLKNALLPKDPWGNHYQYRKPGRDGKEYEIYSLGADGQEGGEGEQADRF